MGVQSPVFLQLIRHVVHIICLHQKRSVDNIISVRKRCHFLAPANALNCNANRNQLMKMLQDCLMPVASCQLPVA